MKTLVKADGKIIAPMKPMRVLLLTSLDQQYDCLWCIKVRR